MAAVCIVLPIGHGLNDAGRSPQEVL